MKKIGIIALVLTIVLGINAISIEKDKYFEILKNLELFSNVYKELNANYVDDIDPGEIMKIGIDAMTNSLDPYTNYISEAQVENYRLETQSKYEGIGAVVGEVNDELTILEAYETSPAIKAGLMIGDRIKKINGLNTEGKSYEDVVRIFRGVPGSKIRFTIDRPGVKQGMEIDLVREEINVPNVPYSGLVGDDDVAYVSLTTFTQNAGDNIRKALSQIKKDNTELKGVILDLRNNGGGLLREAIEVSNIFIPNGLNVVSTRGKVPERDKTYKTTKVPFDSSIPLVVLINKSSASASEIVAGTIQDYDRGVLLGQRSFGKGLVQNTTDIGYNSRIKLTTSKYYIPSNRCIQSVEYENGEPKDIPDDKRTQFKTRNGRTVLDGGGVTPDVRLEPRKFSEFTESLQKEHIIFDYATLYMHKNESIEAPESFTFDEFDDFASYVKEIDFEFTSKAESLVNSLKTELGDDVSEVSEELSGLEEKLNLGLDYYLNNNKEELKELLEIEIISRFYFQKGKVAHRLYKDPEINEAVTLLKSENYQNILRL